MPHATTMLRDSCCRAALPVSAKSAEAQQALINGPQQVLCARVENLSQTRPHSAEVLGRRSAGHLELAILQVGGPTVVLCAFVLSIIRICCERRLQVIIRSDRRDIGDGWFATLCSRSAAGVQDPAALRSTTPRSGRTLLCSLRISSVLVLKSCRSCRKRDSSGSC